MFCTVESKQLREDGQVSNAPLLMFQLGGRWNCRITMQAVFQSLRWGAPPPPRTQHWVGGQTTKRDFSKIGPVAGGARVGGSAGHYWTSPPRLPSGCPVVAASARVVPTVRNSVPAGSSPVNGRPGRSLSRTAAADRSKKTSFPGCSLDGRGPLLGSHF